MSKAGFKIIYTSYEKDMGIGDDCVFVLQAPHVLLLCLEVESKIDEKEGGDWASKSNTGKEKIRGRIPKRKYKTLAS